jgi:hypothetical protein
MNIERYSIKVKKLERPLIDFKYYAVIWAYHRVNGELVRLTFPEQGEEYGCTSEEASEKIESRFKQWLSKTNYKSLKQGK